MVLKLIAEGSRFLDYFRDPFNCFDFLLVAATWILKAFPEAGANSVAGLRMLRLVRIVRSLNQFTKIRVILRGMTIALF